jgi:hypothetical protein
MKMHWGPTVKKIIMHGRPKAGTPATSGKPFVTDAPWLEDAVGPAGLVRRTPAVQRPDHRHIVGGKVTRVRNIRISASHLLASRSYRQASRRGLERMT